MWHLLDSVSTEGAQGGRAGSSGKASFKKYLKIFIMILYVNISQIVPQVLYKM